MAGIRVEDRVVSRIAIVDDDASVRRSYSMSVTDLEVEPVDERGPLPALECYLVELSVRADAAVCDFKLGVKNYAPFNGAELVARWFDIGFPALLCTRWDRAVIDEIRGYRDRIPVLVNAKELDPERIHRGLEVCVRERRGNPVDSRRVFRTLVRIEEVTVERTPFVYVVVPAWNPAEVVKLRVSDVPGHLEEELRADSRLFAEVNLGAESYEDLFFRNWQGR